MDPQKIPTGQPQDANSPDQTAEPTAPEAVSFSGSFPGQPIKPTEATTPEPGTSPAGQTFSPTVFSPQTPAASAAPVIGDNAATTVSPPTAQAAPLPITDDMKVDPLPVAHRSRSKKGLIFGLIIAAVVVLLSGGAAASYYYYTANKPENVLKQALANSMDPSKAPTTHLSGTLVAADETSDMSLEATFKLASDNKTGAFSVAGEADVVVTKLQFDFLSPDAKTFYFKVGGLDGLSDIFASFGEFGTAYAPLIDSVNDQWIEINKSLIEQASGSFEFGQLTEADIKKIAEAYNKHPVFAIKEVLKDELIAGKDSYHYRLVIDAAQAKIFFAALKDAKLEGIKIDQEMVDMFNKSVDDSEVQKTPFDLWISKDDKMISQFVVEASQDGYSGSLKLTVDSYTEPVKVEKPEGAKSLLKVIGELTSRFGLPADAVLSEELLQEGISL